MHFFHRKDDHLLHVCDKIFQLTDHFCTVESCTAHLIRDEIWANNFADNEGNDENENHNHGI